MFENYSKCRIWIVLNFGIFDELLSTQNVNVARFARNVECDFLGDLQTLCCRWAHNGLLITTTPSSDGLVKAQNHTLHCLQYLVSDDDYWTQTREDFMCIRGLVNPLHISSFEFRLENCIVFRQTLFYMWYPVGHM